MKRIVLAACLLTTLQANAQVSTGIFNRFLSPFTISGYAETYYGGDFNNPIGNTRPSFLFNFNKNNEASVNLAFLKGTYNTNKIRANLALAAGTYMNANYASCQEKIICGWMPVSSLHTSVLKARWVRIIGH